MDDELAFDGGDSGEEYDYEDDFEESLDESESMSQYQVYLHRINECELCEVASQQCSTSNTEDGWFESKVVQTNPIESRSMTMQFCEGEDETEFLEAIEKHSKRNTLKAPRTNVHEKTKLLNFMTKYSNAIGSILVAEEHRCILKTSKAIEVSFGILDTKDRSEVNDVLMNSELIFVESLHHEPSVFLTMHRVSVCQNAKKIECVKNSKTIICVWKTLCPQEPTMIMLSESTIGKHCICAMKDTLVCGTREGFIQVWEFKQSWSRNKIIDKAEQHSIHDKETIEEYRQNILAITNVSNTMIASLDCRGMVELWKLRRNEDGEYIELERFKLIKKEQSPSDKAINLVPIPKGGDTILCPLNDGRVTVLSINNDIVLPEISTMYYPDCQVGGTYENMYESNVDQIVFSPFDTSIFLMLWTNGLIGLFHVNNPIACNYWNSWSYLHQKSDNNISDNQGSTYDESISIQWCSKQPCCFYVLTKLGNLFSFRLSKAGTSITCEDTNFLLEKESSFGSYCIQFVSSGSRKDMLPTMVRRNNATKDLFSITLRKLDSTGESGIFLNTDIMDSELKNLQKLVSRF